MSQADPSRDGQSKVALDLIGKLYDFLGDAHQSHGGQHGVVRHGSPRGAGAGEVVFEMSCNRVQLAQDRNRLGTQGNNMRLPRLHPLPRDAPFGGVQVKLGPACVAQFAGIDSAAQVATGLIGGCARIPQRHFRTDAQGEEFFLAGVAILEAPVPAAIGLYQQEESPGIREFVVRNARSGLPDRRVGERYFGGISKSRFEYTPKSTPGKGWQFLAFAGRQWTSLELKNPMFTDV